jgi:hypothetical protein
MNSTVSPAPYDWDGIDISDKAAGTMLTWCRISYSVFGLRSAIIEFRLSNIIFLYNGRSDLSIDGEKKTVTVEPFSYRPVKAPVLVAPLAPNVSGQKNTRRAIRIVSCVVGCVGLAAGVWGTVHYSEADRQKKKILKDWELFTPQDLESAQTQRENNIAILSSGFGIGLIGTVVFTITFLF